MYFALFFLLAALFQPKEFTYVDSLSLINEPSGC